MEDKQKPSVGDLKKVVVQYALRQTCDFHKYKALELIENLKSVAIQCRDKKADYCSTVHVKLLERISKPAEQFKNYVLSLLADRDYEKIIDAVAKVDEAFGNDTPSSAHLDLDKYGPTPSGPRFFSHSPRHSGFSPSFFGYQRTYPYYFPRYNRRGGGFKRRPCDYCEGFNHRPNNCFKKNLYRKANNLGKNSKDP